MKFLKPENLRNSISTHLLRVVFSFYLLIAVVVTLGHMVMDYRYQKENILNNLKNIQASFEKGLAIDIWRLDQEEVAAELDGLLSLAEVLGVKITNNQESLIAVGGVIRYQDTLGTSEQLVNLLGVDKKLDEIIANGRFDFEVFEHSFPVHYTHSAVTQKLGDVTLFSGSSVVFRRVKLGYIMLIMNAILKTAALWVIFLWFANKIIRKPLRSLTKATEQTNLDNLSFVTIQTGTKGSNELKVLEDSFNSMINSLKLSIKERTESEEKFRILVTNSEQIVFMISKEGIFELSEGKGLSSLGLKPSEGVGQSVFKLYKNSPEIIEGVINALEGKTADINTMIDDQHFKCWLTPRYNEQDCIIGLLGLGVNITDQIETENKLKKALNEKETLLQEIHHRVKNNMQVISSLLQLQEQNIENKQIKDVLKESQSRVYAMSAVHELLHGSENLSEIDLETYLQKVTTSIFDMFSKEGREIKLKSTIDQSPISINQAYPLGLILNELISNSMKYAFPGSKAGEVTIDLSKSGEEIRLIIKDNGIGMPNNFDWKSSNSLGLKLVQILVENQLDGSIDLDNSSGTKFTINFKHEKEFLN